MTVNDYVIEEVSNLALGKHTALVAKLAVVERLLHHFDNLASFPGDAQSSITQPVARVALCPGA